MSMLRPYQAVLLVGPPGSGKSTQGKIKSLLPGIYYWEAGEALRAVDPDSNIGRIIGQHSSRGELIPDEWAVSLCLDDLKARMAAGAYHPETDILVLEEFLDLSGRLPCWRRRSQSSRCFTWSAVMSSK